MSGPEEQGLEDGAGAAGDVAAAPDDGAAATEVAAAGEAVSEDLDAMLADVRRERDEYLQLAQRARADFDNYRRRAARDAEDAERRGRVELARGLLPAIDNLERALRAAGAEPTLEHRDEDSAEPESREVSAHEALAAGVALVHGELVGTLERAGIEAFDPLGDPFDPVTCEAISTRPPADGESGEVLETLERGYRLGETLIRPARVVVAG